jgi:hypothetical protein
MDRREKVGFVDEEKNGFAGGVGLAQGVVRVTLEAGGVAEMRGGSGGLGCWIVGLLDYFIRQRRV